jgi:hypothetical protein
LIELLEAGELNLTSIKLIGPHLTQANHLQVLDRVRGKSKREVEQLVAELAPQPDVAASLRRLPERSRRRRAAPAMSLAERLALGELPLVAATAAVSASPVAAASVESIAAALVSGSPAAASIYPTAADLSGTAAAHSAPPSASIFTFALTPSQRAATRPLSPGRFKLVLTLDQEQHDKLEQLRELLRHQIPDGDLAPIVNLAISELLERKRQQRFAQPRSARKGQTAPRKQRDASRPRQGLPDRDSPRTDAQPHGASQNGGAQLRDATLDRGGAQERDAPLGRGGTQERDATLGRGGTQERDATLGRRGTQERDTGLDRGGPLKRDAARGRGRYIPREVVRAVFARDVGRCTFVGDNGQRCDARGFLELHHHEVTYARGGEASVENLRLMCRCHNALLAERDYGARYMKWRASSAISDRTASANGGPSLL